MHRLEHVAGDVFETMHPSAEALELYYGFLARVRDCPALRKVVVVGGNHDSPSRLDAPEAILGALDVHVVGGWTKDTVQRSVCEVRDDDGAVELVIGAVPFVHEYRLGVRTAGRMPGDIELDLRREFARLYHDVANACVAAAEGAPIIAMGHLTCSAAEQDDYRSAIHQASRVGGFSPEIFDPRFRYVALGHIHKTMEVSPARPDEPGVWYSGSPIALNRREAKSPRHVLLLDVRPDGVDVESIEVPPPRPIVALDGSLDDVLAELRALTWEQVLEPYVLVTVRGEERVPNVARRFDEALESLPEGRRPRIVNVREQVSGEARARRKEQEPEPEALAELDPEDVFVRLYQTVEGDDVPPEMLTAFRSLLVVDDEREVRADVPEEQGALSLGDDA
jgi:exonuclease SbcD